MLGARELDPLSSLSDTRWHPKLTPYRLLVLGTTIGIGTAKAFVAQYGNQSGSTTLEWISGVVIFLILYSLSTYDDRPKDPPFHLGWLFTVDCMDYLWRLLWFFHMPRPAYSSEPAPIAHTVLNVHGNTSKKNAAPITLYRLFVCFTTTVFGLTKAVITYLGYSYGASWIDWALGVVVTSVLFVLGMYENNTIGMWNAFFVLDYTTETQHGLAALFIFLSIPFWLGASIWLAFLMWSNPDSIFLSTVNAPVPISSLTPLCVLRERLFDACFTLFMVPLVAIHVLSGVGGIATVLNSSGLPRWKHAGKWIMGQRSAWNDRSLVPEPRGRRLLKKIAYHIVSVTIFLLGCVVFLAFWIVCVAVNAEEGHTQLHSNVDFKSGFARNLGSFARLAIIILFQTTSAVATVYLMWFVIRDSLLLPLWKWRSGEGGWDRVLLF